MDRDRFAKELAVSEVMNNDCIEEILIRSIESNLGDGNPRGHRNLIIFQEELSELTKEISKELRGKGNKVNILEELADVQISIYYIQNICHITNSELDKAIAVKMKRLNDILVENGMFK